MTLYANLWIRFNTNEVFMGGYFGVASKSDCVFVLVYGVDYHSHLGTRRAGVAVYCEENGGD